MLYAFAWTFLFSTLTEYWMHRLPMHRRQYSINGSRERHGAHHLEDFFEVQQPYVFGKTSAIFWFIPSFAVASIGFGYLWGADIGLTIFTTVTAHVALYEFGHYNMHRRHSLWYDRFRLYRVWVEWHRTHHADQRTNFAVTIFAWVWDIVFFTLKIGEIRVAKNAPTLLAGYTGVLSALFGRRQATV